MSTATTTAVATTYVVDDCRGVLQVYSDGSIVRSSQPSFPVPIRDDGTVDWKDVEYDPARGLSLRLYKPRDRRPTDPPKFPVFYYFHGGGFCIGSRTWPNCQNYCLRLAAELRAVVVAPDYRLAPEHRLPAALEDGLAAVEWLRDLAASPEATDPWLSDSTDFTRVFVSGDSAGGTIAHQLAVKFGSAIGRSEASPLRVRGYIMLMPFFGGIEPTVSEVECPKDAFLNRELSDRFWRLSIPVGATVDHPLVNPFGPDRPQLEPVEFEPMLVVVGGRDLLKDRAAEYAARLKGMGKPVELVEFEGQQHGFFTIDPWSEPAARLMGTIKRFMEENAGSD